MIAHPSRSKHELKVFIDGRHGTTGLKIDERLAGRAEIEIHTIPEAQRKDAAVRRNTSTVPTWCSCACRTQPRGNPSHCSRRKYPHPLPRCVHRPPYRSRLVYGLPELNAGQREKVARAQKVAVPGCHASGFIMLMHLLVAAASCLPTTRQHLLITGYSGGGKEMIASYEDARGAGRRHEEPALLRARPRPQASAGDAVHDRAGPQTAVHPIVGNFAQGMVVAVPLLPRALARKATRRCRVSSPITSPARPSSR